MSTLCLKCIVFQHVVLCESIIAYWVEGMGLAAHSNMTSVMRCVTIAGYWRGGVRLHYGLLHTNTSKLVFSLQYGDLTLVILAIFHNVFILITEESVKSVLSFQNLCGFFICCFLGGFCVGVFIRNWLF